MSFSQIQKNGITYLSSDILPSGILHGFSTRLGGVSVAPWDSLNLGIGRGDNLEDVKENYRRFCTAIGADVQRVVLSKQIHEANVRLVTDEDCGKGLWYPRDYTSVDAMICNTPGIPLVVFSADCNVILLYDPVHRAIGAAHAGWRGSVAGIVKNTVDAMVSFFGSNPADIHAAIGPAIHQCCFETDQDVPDALYASIGDAANDFMIKRGEKWHIDLQAVNAWWLNQAGVNSVDICPLCTGCRQDLFWSHRKVGNARGAQIAMIALEDIHA